MLAYIVSRGILRRTKDDTDLVQHIHDLDMPKDTSKVRVKVYDILPGPFASLSDDKFVPGQWWHGTHIRCFLDIIYRGVLKPSTSDNVRTECSKNGCYLSTHFDASSFYGTRHRLDDIRGSKIPSKPQLSEFTPWIKAAYESNAECTQPIYTCTFAERRWSR